MPTAGEEQLVCAPAQVKEQRRRLKGDSEAQDARRRSFICWYAANTSGGMSSLLEHVAPACVSRKLEV